MPSPVSNPGRLSPTAVASHLACRHLTQLERARREGRLAIELPRDPRLEALIERGARHEQAYVDSLRARGLRVLDLGGERNPYSTVAAMRDRWDVIVQATLQDSQFGGRADVLLRVPEPASELGEFSYEPVDAKLTRETRAGTILQLCVYAEVIAAIQGRVPDRFRVVTPAGEESYRTADFAAYFRFVRERLAGAIVAEPPPETYPEPVAHCDVCSYWSHCVGRRRSDDHLSLVAGIHTTHRRELVRQGISTVAGFAAVGESLPEAPQRGTPEVFAQLAHQARLQVRARETETIPFDVLEPEVGRGLARLPERSRGDVFLDFEGDPFVEGGGLEYLTGWAFQDLAGEWHYEPRWASNLAEERVACEAFLDFISERWARHPDLHVFHFGTYEPAALKRMVSRHGTRAEALDRVLRGGRLVDLHAVVREGLRVGVERYGLKELEPLCGFRRTFDLEEARRARLEAEIALEVGAVGDVEEATRRAIVEYNREDCRSTAALRDWLEGVRSRAIEGGASIPRPPDASGEASETVTARGNRIRAVADALIAGLPGDAAERNPDQQARWLLANLLGYFHREEKCAWWEHFRLRDLDGAQLVDEREALGGLRFREVIAPAGRKLLPAFRFEFPPQETTLGPGTQVHALALDDPEGGPFGEVCAIDPVNGSVEVRPAGRKLDIRPSGLFASSVVPAGTLEESLLALGERVRDAGLEVNDGFRAACDLLLRRAPRQKSGTGGALRWPDEGLVAATARVCRELDGGVLPIQGPPGTGKTFVGARAIVELVGEGRRIGITAVSHKVIDNLLAEVRRAAAEKAVEIRLVHKGEQDTTSDRSGIEYARTNANALAAARGGAVVGGTAWLWARDDAAGALDFLFVDEAGQVSLAQTLAAARSARNLVLLGDPQQLEQPRRGAHPDGTEVAALVHLIGPERATLGDEQGLFLDRTWRMHPQLCAFTSEAYYDGRLSAVDGLDRQQVTGPTAIAGAGAFLVEVAHEGNQASSPEEVEATDQVVRNLLRPGIEWVDQNGGRRPLLPSDVLVVAPFNAQVALLRRRLEKSGVMRVGTVDRFQGQEAPVVIYSCTSSSAEDAPRGMEFLYDAHRFNVATSRARGVVVVVASPRLFEVECRTVGQMRMANAFSRLRELARVVNPHLA